jgi:flavin reductase (DIM6/NTAB) family NADH-FMN oxidoreductase RutF
MAFQTPAAHSDFPAVEASRPPWNREANLVYHQKPDLTWSWGRGANSLHTPADAQKQHIEIDPYAANRDRAANYKLLISAICPRPIGFASTISLDSKNSNLAPYSFFNCIGSDPPLFVFGFAGSLENPKDPLKNLLEQGECTVNIVSENYLEAMNAASVNAPHGVSEWTLTGLTPAPSRDVKPARVKEAIFSVEGKLVFHKEFKSKVTGKGTSVLAVIEGSRFWVREDAINEARDFVDPAVSFVFW